MRKLLEMIWTNYIDSDFKYESNIIVIFAINIVSRPILRKFNYIFAFSCKIKEI